MPAEIIFLDPMEVKIRDGMPRFRTDSPNVKSLLQSMEKFGQLMPALINREHELIDGGRRQAACILGQRKMMCVYNDTVDELTMREMEFEANVQREDFSPADHALAVKELHRLKTEIHGQAIKGFDESGWTLEDTAKVMNVSEKSVRNNLEIADLVELYPELKKLKTATEIRKAGDAINSILKNAEGSKEFEFAKKAKFHINIQNMDATEFLHKFEDNSVDLFLTDPPYGIDISKVAMNVGKRTGGEVTTAGFKFDDSTSTMFNFIRLLATESARIARSDGQAYIFMAPEFFGDIRQIFMDAGWNVHVRPLIWIKRTSGQNNMPERWPSSCYEMVMYARMPEAKIIKQGRPDWFQFDPIIGNKRHPTEKPIQLLRELIQRSVRPGASLVDPCMGSGSSLVAGIKEKLLVHGCDILKESYDSACAYVNETLKEEEDGRGQDSSREDTGEQ